MYVLCNWTPVCNFVCLKININAMPDISSCSFTLSLCDSEIYPCWNNIVQYSIVYHSLFSFHIDGRLLPVLHKIDGWSCYLFWPESSFLVIFNQRNMCGQFINSQRMWQVLAGGNSPIPLPQVGNVQYGSYYPRVTSVNVLSPNWEELC